ncbi:TRAP transporter small permease subunit [Thalassotalea ganghwensis]
MSSFKSAIDIIDRFTDLTGRAIAWLTLLMVVLSFLIVLLRYGFNLGWIAMQESVLYLHGIVFMLGCAYTLKADGHVRVDIFYQRFSHRKQAWVNFLGTVFLLVPVCSTIFYLSFDYVMASWKILEKSGEAGGLPFVYLNKTLILLLPFLVLLQGIAEASRQFLILRHHQGESC